MNASYDAEVNAYYFSAKEGEFAITKSISLGQREVIVDIDINGVIVGVEVL